MFLLLSMSLAAEGSFPEHILWLGIQVTDPISARVIIILEM